MIDPALLTGTLARGVFSGQQDGLFLVEVDDRTILCDLLITSALPHQLQAGSSVIILLPRHENDRGVILGQVSTPAPRSVPDELIIKARKNLRIECGEGSITLRDDGKILIKGKDLVSRAQRMNRIKGGGVAIN